MFCCLKISFWQLIYLFIHYSIYPLFWIIGRLHYTVENKKSWMAVLIHRMEQCAWMIIFLFLERVTICHALSIRYWLMQDVLQNNDLFFVTSSISLENPRLGYNNINECNDHQHQSISTDYHIPDRCFLALINERLEATC